MPNLPESWDPIAHTLGYKTEEEMLLDLYEIQGMSINEIAKNLGYSSNNVRRRLIIHNVVLHSRGGNNNVGGSKLIELTDEYLLTTPPKKVAETHGVHLSTVFHEFRRRKLCTPAQLRRMSTSLNALVPADGTSPSLSGVESLSISDSTNAPPGEERG